MSFRIEIIGEEPHHPSSPEEHSMPDDNHLTMGIIGDSAPFSRLGNSIGYRIVAGNSQFLVDCGAPVFQLLGPDGLSKIEGIIGTHAHEDHKRWFTDIALHQKFTHNPREKVTLMGSHGVLDDYRRASVAALEQTLSPDSKKVMNIPYDDYVDSQSIAPVPRYQLKRIPLEDGGEQWRVVDEAGQVVSPERARIFTQPGIDRPRMLIRDPQDKIWVEPDSYYSFDDERFYKTYEFEPYQHDCGLTVIPVKATAWHGLHTTSLLFKFEGEQLYFSSDTNYDPQLWENLSTPRDPEKDIDDLDSDRFIVEDDINNYIQQTWSQQRTDRALSFYQKEHPIIHDVSGPWAVVHTSYGMLEQRTSPLLLTHSPDKFVTVHPLAHLGKTFELVDGGFVEIVDGIRYPLNATCYYKKYSNFYVGYHDEDGDYVLVKKSPGQLDVKKRDDVNSKQNGDFTVLCRISLYEEIEGEYFPFIDDELTEYVQRPDGKVERVSFDQEGSTGEICEGLRETLSSQTARIPQHK